jgi:hypothetical protein
VRQVQQLGKDAVGEPCIPDVLPCPITDSPLHTIAGHYRFMNAREALVQLNGLPPNTTVPCLTYIRKPVERLVSFYYWMLHERDDKVSGRGWLCASEVDDVGDLWGGCLSNAKKDNHPTYRPMRPPLCSLQDLPTSTYPALQTASPVQAVFMLTRMSSTKRHFFHMPFLSLFGTLRVLCCEGASSPRHCTAKCSPLTFSSDSHGMQAQ